MKMLAIIAALFLITGCNSHIVQPTTNDITTRCFTGDVGTLVVADYKTVGCTTTLPDDVREAIVKGKMAMRYQCDNGRCKITVQSKR